MDLSNIKKIVLEEGKVVVIDGDNALVIMSYDEYRKMKQPDFTSLLSKKQGFLIDNEKKEVDLTQEKPMSPETREVNEKAAADLTLDDLPF